METQQMIKDLTEVTAYLYSDAQNCMITEFATKEYNWIQSICEAIQRLVQIEIKNE